MAEGHGSQEASGYPGGELPTLRRIIAKRVEAAENYAPFPEDAILR